MFVSWADGDAVTGYDEAGFLVATIVAYTYPDGHASVPRTGDRYWLAFVRQDRVPGAWPTAEQARAAPDAEHAARCGG